MNQLTLTFLVVCLRVNYVQQFTSSRISVILGHGMQADETSDTEAFVRELEQRVPQHGDTFINIVQQIEQKGVEKAIQLGEQRGIDRNTVMKMTSLTEDILVQIRH